MVTHPSPTLYHHSTPFPPPLPAPPCRPDQALPSAVVVHDPVTKQKPRYAVGAFLAFWAFIVCDAPQILSVVRHSMEIPKIAPLSRGLH